MPASHFSGPLKVGTVREGSAVNQGTVTLAQVGTLTFDATLVQSLTFTIPKNCQLLDYLIDVITAYDSATSATLSAGTAAAGTQYVSGVNAKTTGRAAPTLTTTQLTNMQDTTTNTSVVFTVTSVGQPTAGSVKITVRYAMSGTESNYPPGAY